MMMAAVIGMFFIGFYRMLFVTPPCRIIKRTLLNGEVEYTIQQKHFLFWWWWVDGWVNKDVSTTDSFKTLEEAKANLKYFDGSRCIEKVVK